MHNSAARPSLFGIVAPELGWTPPLRYLLRRNRVLKLLTPLCGDSLLEIGCGSGALLADLAVSRKTAIGFETSKAALTMSKGIIEKSGQNLLITSEMKASWEEMFDIVCAFDVLEHIEEDRTALQSWVKLAKPRGHICLSVPAHRHRWGAGDEWAGHWRRYDRDDIISLVESCGLRITHLECYGFPLANLTEHLGNRTYRRLIHERSPCISHAEASAESGTNRQDYQRLHRYINTFLGRFALRCAFAAQELSSQTNWGSGYLILSQRT